MQASFPKTPAFPLDFAQQEARERSRMTNQSICFFYSSGPFAASFRELLVILNQSSVLLSRWPTLSPSGLLVIDSWLPVACSGLKFECLPTLPSFELSWGFSCMFNSENNTYSVCPILSMPFTSCWGPDQYTLLIKQHSQVRIPFFTLFLSSTSKHITKPD